MNITIDESVKNCCGVYKIQFGNGKYYIGSSGNVLKRVKGHISKIERGFFLYNTCLYPMNGYDGDVLITLVEEVTGNDSEKDREYDYIKANIYDENLLNKSFGGNRGRVPVGTYVTKEVKDALQAIADRKGLTLGCLMELALIEAANAFSK